MGAVYLSLQLILVFGLTVFLLNKYANLRKQHLVVLALTFIGWYFSFLIIFILPLDIAITFYRKCGFDQEVKHNESLYNNVSFEPFECEEPKGYISDNTLLSTWRVIYWLAQLLTWIVLPMMQSYSNAGDFTPTGKLKTAFYNNAAYYGTYGVIFVFLVFYAVGKGVSLSFEHLKILLISASNTWGLFILVVLLGYGLVEVPRQLWQMGNREYRINKAYFDIDKLSTDRNDAEEAVREVYFEAKDALNILQNQRGLARHKAQVIVSKFPSDFVDELNQSKRSGAEHRFTSNSVDSNIVSNDKYLISS
uniref:Uncharacterized protein n=1 Tax=Acrobeloides nanus TaxID=290746 RepID=A0A914EJH6_9BILA